MIATNPKKRDVRKDRKTCGQSLTNMQQRLDFAPQLVLFVTHWRAINKTILICNFYHCHIFIYQIESLHHIPLLKQKK